MKILIVSHSAEYLGGAERSILQLAERIQSKEFEIIFCVPAKGTLYEKISRSGFEVTVIPYTWSTDYDLDDIDDSLLGKADENLHAIASISQFIRTNGIDIVLTNTATTPWAGFASKVCGVPHVWFVREFLDLHFKNPERQAVLIDKLSDLVVANSEAISINLSTYISSHKIKIVYPTFDKPLDTKEKTSSNNINLTVVGPITPQKSQLTAVEAISKLKDEPYFHKIRLNFVGSISSEDYMKKIKAFTKKEGLDNKIQFHGNIDDIENIYNTTDITLVCSSREAFGRSIVESMLRKIPVIAQNSNGPKYVIENGVTGYLYEPNSADDLAKKIHDAITRSDKREKIVNQAKSYALKNFREQPARKFTSSLKKVYKRKNNNSWLKDLGLLAPFITHYDNILKENSTMKSDIKFLQDRIEKMSNDPFYIKSWRPIKILKKLKR